METGVTCADTEDWVSDGVYSFNPFLEPVHRPPLNSTLPYDRLQVYGRNQSGLHTVTAHKDVLRAPVKLSDPQFVWANVRDTELLVTIAAVTGALVVSEFATARTKQAGVTCADTEDGRSQTGFISHCHSPLRPYSAGIAIHIDLHMTLA